MGPLLPSTLRVHGSISPFLQRIPIDFNALPANLALNSLSVPDLFFSLLCPHLLTFTHPCPRPCRTFLLCLQTHVLCVPPLQSCLTAPLDTLRVSAFLSTHGAPRPRQSLHLRLLCHHPTTTPPADWFSHGPVASLQGLDTRASLGSCVR